MFHFRTTALGALKTIAPVAAFACSLALASPGNAAAIFLQSATMDTSRTATISGPGGFSQNVYIGPLNFTAYNGTSATGPSFNFIGFCVDIFHHISLGTLNLKYDDTRDLTTNSAYTTATPFQGGTALTSGQIAQVSKLVNYGNLVYAQAPAGADRTNKLAGLQGAIWKVINPTYNVTSGTAGVNTYITAYSGANYLNSLTGYGPVGGDIDFITETGKYGTNAAHQSFALAAVPEPAAWALMIGGFGIAGALLRRRRAFA